MCGGWARGHNLEFLEIVFSVLLFTSIFRIIHTWTICSVCFLPMTSDSRAHARGGARCQNGGPFLIVVVLKNGILVSFCI